MLAMFSVTHSACRATNVTNIEAIKIVSDKPMHWFQNTLQFKTLGVSLCIRFRNTKRASRLMILWHVDPLLKNDSEINSYTAIVGRRWLSRNHVNIQTDVKAKEGLFSTRTVPRNYKRDSSQPVRMRARKHRTMLASVIMQCLTKSQQTETNYYVL
jgi:hypothetical protein